MSASHFTQSQLLEKFETALANAEHPGIAPQLATAGYDAGVLAADRDLLALTRTARDAQQTEAAEARVAHETEAMAEKAARAAFTLLHRLIHLGDRRAKDLDIESILQTKALPAPEAAFLDYATALLERIGANAGVAAALAGVGVTTARVAELRGLLDAMRQANIAQDKERGEAEQATAVFHTLVEQVRLAYDLLDITARQALSATPQMLELMGFGAV